MDDGLLDQRLSDSFEDRLVNLILIAAHPETLACNLAPIQALPPYQTDLVSSRAEH